MWRWSFLPTNSRGFLLNSMFQCSHGLLPPSSWFCFAWLSRKSPTTDKEIRPSLGWNGTLALKANAYYSTVIVAWFRAELRQRMLGFELLSQAQQHEAAVAQAQIQPQLPPPINELPAFPRRNECVNRLSISIDPLVTELFQPSWWRDHNDNDGRSSRGEAWREPHPGYSWRHCEFYTPVTIDYRRPHSALRGRLE